MIKALEDYFETIISELCYGQIPETPNNLANINIYDKGKTPYFNDTKTHILTLNLYIRDESYENMQTRNEVVGNSLSDIYDISVSQYHIVNIKKVSSAEPTRDTKNRYSITSTFEVLIEEV